MPFIPLEVFANNATTTVTAGGTTGPPSSGTQESWTVFSSGSFPVVEIGATQFHVADPAAPTEMITVQNIAGTAWTVLRGAEGTTPVLHTSGFTVVEVVTAGVLAAGQYASWQFPVQAYSAQGDGKIGTGGTGASGQAILTDAGATFVNATAPAGDVGKVIIVNQGTGSATVGTNPFCGTISSVNSATSITLSGNLTATCAAAPYVYGTDDAAAINAAVAAAAKWAVATGNYKAQVMFEPQLYMLGALVQSTTQQWSPFNTGLNYTYNCHIPVPFTGQYARKLAIDMVGTGGVAQPDFWGSALPGVQGTCLVSASFTSSQPNGTYGQQSVIGAPSGQANIGTGGIGGGAYANALITIDGISVVTPFNSQQYSCDFRWIAQMDVRNAAALAFAPVNYGSQTCGGPWLRATNNPANTVAVGLAMPAIGNNDFCHIGTFSAEGIATGLTVSEHFTAQRIDTIYCGTGIAVAWVPAGTIVHGGSIQYWSCEGTGTGLYSAADNTHLYPLFIALADFEVMGSYWVNDVNGNLTGRMFWNDLGANWSPVGAGTVNQNYEIVNTRMPRGIWASVSALSVPAPPAAPSSGTAQQNTPYRPATVWCSAATSITSFTVAPTSAGLASSAVITVTAGANVGVPIRVPSGHWFKVTYSGTLTTTWVIE